MWIFHSQPPHTAQVHTPKQMGWTCLEVQVSILRSDPGKLYKLVSLFCPFSLKSLHRVNFYVLAFPHQINMWMGVSSLKKKKKRPAVRRSDGFCAVINQSLFKSCRTYCRHIITSDPIFKMSGVMRFSVRDEAEIKTEMTATLLPAFFTSFILMSALQTTFPDRLSF